MYLVVSQKPSTDDWERHAPPGPCRQDFWKKSWAMFPVRVTMEPKWGHDVIVWGQAVEVATGPNSKGVIQNWYRCPFSKHRIEQHRRRKFKMRQKFGNKCPAQDKADG